MEEELKIVIQIKGDRALVGIQQKDTDPVLEPLEAVSLEEILAAVPTILARAREQWQSSPRRPKYEGPPVSPPPVPIPQRQPAAISKPKDPQVAAGQKSMM